MKLLSLTNRYHLLSIVVILTLGGICGYFILKNIINHEFNEKLFADRDQFLYEWHTYDNIQEVFYLNIGDKINISKLEEQTILPLTLKDTLMWDEYENKELPFRMLTFYDKLGQEYYQITITKSLLPNDDLIKGVGEIVILLLVGIVVSLVFVNRQISKTIWAPFYDTLLKLGAYQVTTTCEVQFEKTEIYEFKQLNHVIEKMLLKTKSDYLNMKEFTENASHEMQTPLAIIKSKSELLIQDENLPENILEEIGKINEATTRLSKLNTSLSMLAKMDNNQFAEVEPIDLVAFIEKNLTYFEELIELKNINLSKRYDAKPVLILNYTLAYILISNLLNNAIKHNISNGRLSITVLKNKMIFENTGLTLPEDPELYFKRFKKGNNSVESSGLGLALIKKICDNYTMTIRYTMKDDVHRIEIQY